MSPTSAWLAALSLVLAALLWIAASRLLRERARRTGRKALDRSPVELVDPSTIAPIFARSALGVSRESEAMIVGDDGATATTTEREAWLLAALARSARRIFEFGTASGRTTYILARNASQATVSTLTLRPEDVTGYQEDAADPESAKWRKTAANESAYETFYYSGTDVAPRIEQLFGDSKAFDEAPFADRCDLVFIDGSHAYSYVVSDSAKALKMVAPGGYVVWHDFSPLCPGVYRALDELGRTLPLKHVRGTRLVVYHRQAENGR